MLYLSWRSGLTSGSPDRIDITYIPVHRRYNSIIPLRMNLISPVTAILSIFSYNTAVASEVFRRVNYYPKGKYTKVYIEHTTFKLDFELKINLTRIELNVTQDDDF